MTCPIVSMNLSRTRKIMHGSYEHPHEITMWQLKPILCVISLGWRVGCCKLRGRGANRLLLIFKNSFLRQPHRTHFLTSKSSQTFHVEIDFIFFVHILDAWNTVISVCIHHVFTICWTVGWMVGLRLCQSNIPEAFNMAQAARPWETRWMLTPFSKGVRFHVAFRGCINNSSQDALDL